MAVPSAAPIITAEPTDFVLPSFRTPSANGKSLSARQTEDRYFIIWLAAIGCVMCLCFLMLAAARYRRRPDVSSPTEIDDDDEKAKERRAKVISTMFEEQTKGDEKMKDEKDTSTAEEGLSKWKGGSKDKTDADDSNTSSCAICLEAFGENDSIFLSSCGSHSFHRDCILSWAIRQSTCPMCRQPMWRLEIYERIEKEILEQEANESNTEEIREVD